VIKGQGEAGARERRRPQHEADLLAEAAAGDEPEPLHALGELVGEDHRDPTAHRVADDRGALVPERGQQVAQAARVGAERVVAARLGRAAVAEQVRRDDREVPRERRHHAAPGVRAGGDPVHEQQHRAGSRLVVRDGVAVERDLLAAQGAGHAAGRRTSAMIDSVMASTTAYPSRVCPAAPSWTEKAFGRELDRRAKG
jgi:hypothetical protein